MSKYQLRILKRSLFISETALAQSWTVSAEGKFHFFVIAQKVHDSETSRLDKVKCEKTQAIEKAQSAFNISCNIYHYVIYIAGLIYHVFYLA